MCTLAGVEPGVDQTRSLIIGDQPHTPTSLCQSSGGCPQPRGPSSAERSSDEDHTRFGHRGSTAARPQVPQLLCGRAARSRKCSAAIEALDRLAAIRRRGVHQTVTALPAGAPSGPDPSGNAVGRDTRWFRPPGPDGTDVAASIALGVRRSRGSHLTRTGELRLERTPAARRRPILRCELGEATSVICSSTSFTGRASNSRHLREAQPSTHGGVRYLTRSFPATT